MNWNFFKKQIKTPGYYKTFNGNTAKIVKLSYYMAQGAIIVDNVYYLHNWNRHGKSFHSPAHDINLEEL